MASNDQIAAPKFLRQRWDWLFLASVLSLLPLLGLATFDLWYRTDFLFFPLLPLASILFIAWNGKMGVYETSLRAYFSLAAVLVAALAAVGSALWMSPWLAVLSVTLVCIGWMLQRMGEIPWYRIVNWMLPMAFFLILPLSDATNYNARFEQTVLESTSALLDMIGVPNLATDHNLVSKSAVLTISRVCRGFENPYLLLFATLLLLMLTRYTATIGLLVLLTVPAWSWFGSVCHATVGVYALEEHELNVLAGYRNLGVQITVFILQLLFVWIFSRGMKILIAPFTNYSATTSGIHKFFNKVVLWPAPDTLRKRREQPKSDPASIGAFWRSRWVVGSLVLGVCMFAAASAFATYRISSERTQRLLPLGLTTSELEAHFSEDDLPSTIGGLQKVAFDINSQTDYLPYRHSVLWAYANVLEQLQFTVTLPNRGFPVDRDLDAESRAAQLMTDNPPSSIQIDGLGEFPIQESIEVDEFQRNSHVLRVHVFSAAPADNPVDGGESMSLQPTVITLMQSTDVANRLTPETVAQLREAFQVSCSRLQQPLQELFNLDH